MISFRLPLLGCFFTATLFISSAAAEERSAWDAVWERFTLFQSESGFLNEVRLTGRYQGQFFKADASSGSDDDYENRRARLGLRLLLLDKELQIMMEAQSNDAWSPAYDTLTDVFAEYKPDAHWQFRLGKWQPHFGNDFGISSREIITFERGALVNQMGIFFTPGMRVGYTHGAWSLLAAAFSNSTDKEVGDFNGGVSSMVSLSYDMHEKLRLKQAEVRLDWLHSDHDADDNRLNFFTDALSLNSRWQQGALGLHTDLIAGTGPQGDAFGLTFTPQFHFTAKLELVTRYQLSAGSDAATLKPLRRYERAVVAPSGSLYQAGYIGLNYYLHGHRFKLLTGLEYSQMDGGRRDYQGWTWLAGFRMHL